MTYNLANERTEEIVTLGGTNYAIKPLPGFDLKAFPYVVATALMGEAYLVNIKSKQARGLVNTEGSVELQVLDHDGQSSKFQSERLKVRDYRSLQVPNEKSFIAICEVNSGRNRIFIARFEFQ